MELNRIEKLLDAYFEGTTNLEEERILMNYFNNNHVAEPLLQYKPIFVGLAAARTETTNKNFVVKEKKALKTPGKWKYAVAIMLLLAFGIGGFYFSEPQRSQEEKEALAALENSKKAMIFLSENFNKGKEKLSFVNQFEIAKDKFWKEESPQ